MGLGCGGWLVLCGLRERKPPALPHFLPSDSSAGLLHCVYPPTPATERKPGERWPCWWMKSWRHMPTHLNTLKAVWLIVHLCPLCCLSYAWFISVSQEKEPPRLLKYSHRLDVLTGESMVPVNNFPLYRDLKTRFCYASMPPQSGGNTLILRDIDFFFFWLSDGAKRRLMSTLFKPIDFSCWRHATEKRIWHYY